MSDEHKTEEGGMHVGGPGFEVNAPKSLVDGLTPALARWLVPAVAIGTGILLVCWGIAKIVAAFKGAPQP